MGEPPQAKQLGHWDALADLGDVVCLVDCILAKSQSLRRAKAKVAVLFAKKRWIPVLLGLGILVTPCCAFGAEPDGSSFSFAELATSPTQLAPVQTLKASDGTELAFREYLPSAPVAVLVLYHGGGAHSAAGYQTLGRNLADRNRIAVYTPDLRGHGASGGPRGDAPSSAQVLEDIGTVLDAVRSRHPGLPLFLGGHSSGVGAVVNFLTGPHPRPVEGMVLISPEFGHFAAVDRPNLPHPFASVSVMPFILNSMSGGLLGGHCMAIKFNYPPNVLKADARMVTENSVNMAGALTPASPRSQLAELRMPLGLWIGKQDELLDPTAVVNLAGAAASQDKHLEVLEGAKHLSILMTVQAQIGPWITSHTKTGAER